VDDDTFSHHTALSETLKSAVNFCLSQFQILGLLSAIESSLFPSFVKNNVFKRLEESGERLDDIGPCKVYKIDRLLAEEVAQSDKRGEVIKIGSAKIGPSVFLGTIASFDALIVDIVGKLIQLNPSRYLNSDKSIAVCDIINASCKEDILKSFFSDELYRFSRESHDVQTAYIEKNFNVKIRGDWKRYPDFIEVFERRNLIAHGESQFNSRYVSNCKNVGHKGVDQQFGNKVELRYSYQKQALYLLSEYAILLSFMLWRKHASEKESEAFETLNQAAYKLIQDGHYVLAERILAFALGLKNADLTEEVRRMMIVNRASAARSSQDEHACNKILDDADWSASSIQFQISVAALKSDINRVLELVPQAAKLGFEIGEFRVWPVFRFIKEDERFNDALQAHYGERLVEAPKVLEESQPQAADVEPGTVH
jgi:hypothetical protein